MALSVQAEDASGDVSADGAAHARELRRHERVDFARRAWCEHRDFTLYLNIVNVSLDGLFIQTSTPFAPGEVLRVCLSSFTPLAAPLIELEAEVMWSSSRGRTVGVGCRIREFSQGREQYGDLVEQLALLGR